LDAGIGSFAEPTRGLQETADWESLKSLGGCSLIHTSLARTAFIDNDAGTGAIKYIVRSCSLATKQVSAGGETCARLLSVSSSVAAKRTIADAVKGAVRSEIASMQSALDQAAVALATTTRDYARNVIECERAGRKENLSRHRKDLLLAVLGVGARIGAEVLSSGGTSPLTAIKSMWQDKQALARETRPIVDVLRDVFETEKQNIAQCIAAERTASKAKELVLEVQERSEAILKLAATLSSASREILR
jgi:hypothetical protein